MMIRLFWKQAARTATGAVLLAAAVQAVHAATDVWPAGSLDLVGPETKGPSRPVREHRIYPARGERESLQICIRSEKNGLEDVRVEVRPVHKDIPAPDVRVVEWVSVPTGEGTRAVYPDPLTDGRAISLRAGETRSFWLTYYIPEDVKGGLYQNNVTVRWAKRGQARVRITLEVFDFVLPKPTRLKTLFDLNRTVINERYGFDDANLDAWKAVYDALAPYEISYRLGDGTTEFADFRPHVEYAAGTAGMNTIALDPGPLAIDRLLRTTRNAAQDTLAVYLNNANDLLEAKGWLDRAVFEVSPPATDADWSAARMEYGRIKRADGRVRLLMRGPLHPFFENIVDVWAVPVEQYHIHGHRLLREGQSLAYSVAHRALSVSASSARKAPGALGPRDAYDGSFFTAWYSEAAPRRDRRQSLQVIFAAPVRTDRVRIAWPPGYEAPSVRVGTSYDGRVFSDAAVSWKIDLASGPFDFSFSDGDFRVMKTFVGLRLTFDEPSVRGPIGVSEISFGEKPVYGPLPDGRHIEPWLALTPGRFPSLSITAHPVEHRIAPWLCWVYDMDGLLGGALAEWPQNTDLLADGSVTLLEDNGVGFLFYPGANGLMPSIRAERLRDGIEDYVYWAEAKARAIATGAEDLKNLSSGSGLFARSVYDDTELANLGAFMAERRVAIGRALTRSKQPDAKR